MSYEEWVKELNKHVRRKQNEWSDDQVGAIGYYATKGSLTSSLYILLPAHRNKYGNLRTNRPVNYRPTDIKKILKHAKELQKKGYTVQVYVR